MHLSELSIRRPVFAWMLMLGLMFFGVITMQRMGINRLPDVDFPVVEVRLTWEGASPEVMETDVVDIVEESLTSVQGIREMSSSIRQGQASITLEMELGRDIDVAVQEVQTKISQAQRRLPDDIDPPTISKNNPEDQPIIWLSATSDLPLRDLMDYVQNHLKDRFTTINGVGEVFMGGFLERNLRIWIDSAKLKSYELTVDDVIRAIDEGHRELPAGRIESPVKEFNVRTMGEALTPEEFGQIVITRRSGQPVHKTILLKDVAVIEDGLADVRRISRRNGEQAVGLGIRKQRGSNAVDVGQRVLKRLEEIQSEVPEGIKVSLTIDRTVFTQEAIHELKFNLILSAIVTSLICWLFLGSFRSTINILLAIPTSILGTFIFIYFMGFTLNTFTMLALSLAIGIVVDDAIMVLENIVRHKEMGQDKFNAAKNGAIQISFAAIATTAAIIAIFLPVAFMKGIIGKFFFEFGITLSVAVALSLLEALTLTPMRCSQMMESRRRPSALENIIQAGFRSLTDAYAGTLTFVLKFKWALLLLSLVFFATSLLTIQRINKEFVPAQDQGLFVLRLQTPVGSSLTFTDQKFQEVEKFLLSRPEVDRYFSAVGGFGGGEVNGGQITVTLKHKEDRPIVEPYTSHPSQKDVMDHFRKELKKIPDLKVSIQDLSLSGLTASRGYPVELTILGPDWEKLAAFSRTVEEKWKENPILTDVDSNYEDGITEMRIYPDRAKCAERGVDIETIGRTINTLIAGERVAQFTRNGRRYDVRIRLLPDQRTQINDLDRLTVWNNRGELVNLKDVITVREEKTSLTITRKNRERAINLHANVASGKSQAEAIKQAQQMAREILPEGYSIKAGGNTQTFQESFRSLYDVLWLGIVVAYMVLASQFNSYKHPLIILLSLPFSISGALLALWITHQSLNIYSFIGIVLLMGIVKKNAILLVEFTNQLREEGLPVKEALLKASPIRLRPILMTSLATIAAAIPPATALGPGAEALRPMATAVIGGVLLSTLLTLFVVPCAYLASHKDKKHPA